VKPCVFERIGAVEVFKFRFVLGGEEQVVVHRHPQLDPAFMRLSGVFFGELRFEVRPLAADERRGRDEPDERLSGVASGADFVPDGFLRRLVGVDNVESRSNRGIGILLRNEVEDGPLSAVI
jgi:hypothetical protein